MKTIITIFALTVSICVYQLVVQPRASFKSNKWARESISLLRPGDISTQMDYIWNYGAPMAAQVPDRVSRREYTNNWNVPEDLYETPRSVLLHESDQQPGNLNVHFFLYQMLLLLAGGLLLKLYVYPLFLVE